MGAVETRVDPSLHRELWRHREKRGWVTHLVGQAAEHILACAPEQVVSDFADGLIASWEFRDADKIGGPQRTLIERWDYLEVCCGRNAPLISACSKAGLRCGPRIDLLTHDIWDVKSGRLIEWIIYLIDKGRVYFIHSGAPCTTFSIARCPKGPFEVAALRKRSISRSHCGRESYAFTYNGYSLCGLFGGR